MVAEDTLRLTFQAEGGFTQKADNSEVTQLI
jgi:hypothetical protein